MQAVRVMSSTKIDNIVNLMLNVIFWSVFFIESSVWGDFFEGAIEDMLFLPHRRARRG
jgi:hypothetical protein